jgi:hypothetical protein
MDCTKKVWERALTDACAGGKTRKRIEVGHEDSVKVTESA